MVTEKSHCNYHINEQTSLEKKGVEPFEPVLKNIYQNNIYGRDLSWPHFDDEPRVQEKQQVKDQHSCIFVFVACLAIPSSNQGHQPRHDNSILYMGIWQIYGDTEKSQQKETSKNQLNFLGGSFSSLIQFRRSYVLFLYFLLRCQFS